MSSVYKKSSSDDLFGTTSFGCGCGCGCGGSVRRGHGFPDGGPTPGTACGGITGGPTNAGPAGGGISPDLNGNGSVMDEIGAAASIAGAVMTGGTAGVVAGVGAVAGYAGASGW
jgi:hypothetical protein